MSEKTVVTPLDLDGVGRTMEAASESIMRIAVSHELLRERVIALEAAINRHRRGASQDAELYAVLDLAEPIPDAAPA